MRLINPDLLSQKIPVHLSGTKGHHKLSLSVSNKIDNFKASRLSMDLTKIQPTFTSNKKTRGNSFRSNNLSPRGDLNSARDTYTSKI
jgi:hypothetical protein